MHQLRFIIVEDKPFLRGALFAHLKEAAPDAEIIAVDVRPGTQLWNQIPEGDLTGWTVFLDNDLEDGWPKGAQLAPILKLLGAHVLCLSDHVCFVEDQRDWFSEKAFMANGSPRAIEEFNLFLVPILTHAA